MSNSVKLPKHDLHSAIAVMSVGFFMNSRSNLKYIAGRFVGFLNAGEERMVGGSLHDF